MTPPNGYATSIEYEKLNEQNRQMPDVYHLESGKFCGVPLPREFGVTFDAMKTEQGILSPRTRADLVFYFFAPPALALGFWWFQARYGFSPTDDGFVLGQSWRILHGQIPHVDFTSPRPLGSAFLHLPEVLLPWGTLAISRLVVAFQFLWIAIATVDIFLGRDRRSAFTRFCLITIAFLINVGAWPLMPWHTIDGLFIGATVLWLGVRELRHDTWDRARWGAVWLIAGMAPLMKQGFVIVPILAGLMIVMRRRCAGFLLAPIATIPGILYWLLTRRTPGGLQSQLYSGSVNDLVRPLKTLVETISSIHGLIVVGSTVAAVVLMQRTTQRFRVLNFGLAIGLISVPTLFVGWLELFNIGGSWTYLSLVCIVTVSVLLVRDLERFILITALVSLGYAASLSWGVPGPGLLSGSFLATSITLLLLERKGTAAQTPRVRFMTITPLLILSLLVAGLSSEIRFKTTYAELPRTGLTSSVNDPRFALIKMSPQSSTYINNLRSCLRSHPAANVAVLPDGPGLYPLLGMNNPFESDWWLPAEESRDHEARVNKTIDKLNSGSDWLVLFQSYNLFTLPKLPVANVNTLGDPFSYVPGDTRVLEKLKGIEVKCGSLSGKYMPAVAHAK